MAEDEPILTVKPSHWNYFWYYVFFILIVPLVIALIKRASIKLWIYPNRVVVERGLLNKSYKKFFCGDVRTADVRQSLLQRMFGIGDILVSTAGQSGYEVTVEGIPNPINVQMVILQQKEEALGRSSDEAE